MTEKPYLLDTKVMEALYGAFRADADGGVLLPRGDMPIGDTPRNLYRVLLTPRGKCLLTLGETEKHSLSERRSDYENFTELLEILPSLVGSGYYSFVRLALEYFLGVSEIPAPDRAAEVWERSLPLLRDGAFDGMLSPFSVADFLDVKAWVLPSAERLAEYETLDAYAESYTERIKGASYAVLDLADADFRAPDPYHAKQGFDAVRAGKDSADDRTYLFSQMLRVTGDACKKSDIPLILKGDLSEQAVTEMLRYLKKVDRLPRLVYEMPFDDGGGLNARYDLLERTGLLDVLQGIVPIRLPACSTAVMMESMRHSSMRYPCGKLCFVAEGETFVEMRMGYERFARVLARHLSDAVSLGEITSDGAATVGKAVLTARAIRTETTDE